MAQVIGKEGHLIKISLDRKNENHCSHSCKGIYKVGGNLFCYIVEDNLTTKRPSECIDMEINKDLKVKGFNKCNDADMWCYPRVLNGIPVCKRDRTNKQTIAKCVILEDE